MKIDVVFIYPAHSGDGYVDHAWRYLNTYLQCPAGIEHNNIVVCNGGATDQVPDLFRMLPNCTLFSHDNSGYDCGAFQAVARGSSADMIVFFGVSAWIKGAGWLARMAEAFQTHGSQHLYGVMGNSGHIEVGVYPHIRTNGFWMSPAVLNAYPHIVTQAAQRYAFEHGHDCLTQWIRNQGRKAFVVAWHGEFEWPNWDTILNGFHRGDQSSLLIADRLCDPPYYPANAVRQVDVPGGGHR